MDDAMTTPDPITQQAEAVADAISAQCLDLKARDWDDVYNPGKVAELVEAALREVARAQMSAEELAVIELRRKHSNTWRDKSDDFWYRGLVEELLELSLSLDGQHKDSPEFELTQISAIAMNWLGLRMERAARATGETA